MDLDTSENLSMEEEHSEFSHDHPDSYHAEPHKGIVNEDIEKQYCEKSDVMQSANISLSHLLHIWRFLMIWSSLGLIQ